MTKWAWLLTAAIAMSSCTVTLPGDVPSTSTPSPEPVATSANHSGSAAPVAQGQVVADVALAGPAYAVALDTARQRIFVRLAGAVQIFDSSTLQQIASIPVPDGNQWTGLAFDDFLGYLWVPSWSGTVTLIAAGGAPRSAATFPVGLNPGPVAVDRRTHDAYVVCMGREALHDDTFGETWVMDPNAAGPRARIPAGGFPMSVTVNAAANRAYVAVRNPNPGASSFVQVIGAGPDDIHAITTIGTSPLVSLVTDERTNRVYASTGVLPAPAGGFVTAVDGQTAQAMTFVAPLLTPTVLGIDASRGHVYLGAYDGQLVIATERGDTQLNYSVGARYSIATQPMGIAVDELRHRVYAVTFSQRLVVLRDDWP
ncbi:MAG: YncE family protein [Terriglobales bacterium]